MEQLLGVDLVTFDAAGEARKAEVLEGTDAAAACGLAVKMAFSEGNFEAKVVSVTAAFE